MKKNEYLKILDQVVTLTSNQNLRRLSVFEFLAGELILYSMIVFDLFPSISLAIIMFRHFSLMHDASHGTISRNKKWNDFIGNFSGILCFLPYQQWRQVHLEHHYWTGNYVQDPSMSVIKKYEDYPQWIKNIWSISWKLWIPNLALTQQLVFWAVSMTKLKTNGRTEKFLAITPILFWIPLFLIRPVMIGFSIFFYLFLVELVNFPHHLEMPHSSNGKAPVWEQGIATRSCRYPKFFSRFVVLHFNHHLAHHLFMKVPWYLLPRVQTMVELSEGETFQNETFFNWTLQARKKDFTEIIDGTKKTENLKAAA